jgi:hypothetical protein
MKKYIVCELVEAEESGDGYRVYHKDDMEAYCPKDLFNKVYIEVNDNKDLPSGVSIGQQMVDDFIDKVESMTMGEKTTVTQITLKNGFIITESSSCVDPKNYSMEIGEEINLEHAKNKIWELLGFLLQTAYHGFKKSE